MDEREIAVGEQPGDLVVPEGQGKRAEILGTGPDAAPKVVEVMQQLGVA